MKLSSTKPHVVVVGAGYAGLPCALKLSHQSNIRITLVNPEALQELTCDIYRTLRDGEAFSHNFLPQLKKRKINFIEGRVFNVNPLEKYIDVRGLQSQKISYDALIVSSGLRGLPPQIEGLNELMTENHESLTKRIFQFKKNTHAQYLRAALARLNWKDDASPSRDLFVVVLGAGSTGIEVAGELAELRGKNKRCRIILVDEKKEMLSDFSPFARKIFNKSLRQMNIETVLGSPAKSIDSKELYLDNGQVIPWDLLILCTGSYEPPHWAKEFSKVTYQEGLPVNRYFELEPYPHHYVIGDLARYTIRATQSKSPRTLPKRAQFAEQSAYYLAENFQKIYERHSSRLAPNIPVYEPNDLGMLISLGPRDGLGRLGPRPNSRLEKLAAPFVKGAAVDKMKQAIRWRYLWNLKRNTLF